MRCYLVEAPGAKRYGSTQADARDKKAELVELTGAKKADVTITEAEIPMAKAELLGFINDLMTQLDKKDPGDEILEGS